jgi:hypothetical protein
MRPIVKLATSSVRLTSSVNTAAPGKLEHDTTCEMALSESANDLTASTSNSIDSAGVTFTFDIEIISRNAARKIAARC